MAQTEKTADQPGTTPQPAAHDGAVLRNALVRLAETLDGETAALRANQPVNLDAIGDSKNRALLELSRIERRIDRAAIDASLTALLTELKRKLNDNLAILRLHLEAVREITEIISAAERDADSDGTYRGHAAVRTVA